MRQLLATAAVAAAAFAMNGCSQKVGGLTFKDGDFECSRGESGAELKPGELSFLFSPHAVNPNIETSESENAANRARTDEIRRRANVCTSFLSGQLATEEPAQTEDAKR